jgi:putative phosphoesterase
MVTNFNVYVKMVDKFQRKAWCLQMKAIIFSDSHKNFQAMVDAMEREQNVSQIIHAGDVHRDVEDLMIMYPKLPVAFVKGNNDFWLPDVPDDRVFELGGVRIFLTHGHLYSVKASVAGVYKRASELDAHIAIYGHTHVPFKEEIGNVTLFNPGPASKGYGVLEIENGNFVIERKVL